MLYYSGQPLAIYVSPGLSGELAAELLPAPGLIKPCYYARLKDTTSTGSQAHYVQWSSIA
jgi:hypothetical protein